MECARIRLQIAILLRPHGGHHFDGMVTAADNFLLLFNRLIDADASQNATPININGAAEKRQPTDLTLAPFPLKIPPVDLLSSGNVQNRTPYYLY